MRVLVYDVDCEGSGVFYPLKKAFEDIGHNAEMFDWRKYLYAYNSVNILARLKDKVLFDFVAYKINKNLKIEISTGNFDILLVVRGEHLFSETIEFAKKKIRYVVNWNSDDLFNKLNGSKYIKKAFPKYDLHFSPRIHLEREYLDKGAKGFERLDWYYRMNLLFDSPDFLNKVYKNDISFIGSWSKRREVFLNSLKEQNVALYGWGWKKYLSSNELANWNINNNIRIDEMMKIMSVSKININILTVENRDINNFRNYEIPASGGFQMSERSEFIQDLFEEDKEIVCFSSPEELKSKCDFYLKHDSLREKIAIAGYNKLIKGGNSLQNRLKQMIDVINDYSQK